MTTIVYGSSVRFSDKPPTIPGAYWRLERLGGEPTVRIVTEQWTDLEVRNAGGLWSARLIPDSKEAP